MYDLETMGMQAIEAKYFLQKMTTDDKNQALEAIAKALVEKEEYIIAENGLDIQSAEKAGMHAGMVDRLRLTTERIKAIAEGLLQIVVLDDPIGEVLEQKTRPNGMHITKVRVPLGVIGIIYESRPNVTVDAFGLCFKAGNAVVLKGGSDALNSNKAIVKVIHDTLTELQVDKNVIQLIESTDRSVTVEFMKMKQYIDVLIPRGSAGLIRSVVENSTIPVIETGTGNCHIYVDEFADLQKAVPIIFNAKTQRIGVCNACESLVVHEAVREALLPTLAAKLSEKNVEIRGDERTAQVLTNCTPATEEDFAKEFLDYIISIKTVNSLEEAIAHINKYSTKHSEAIITENKENARKFENEIDAACVYVNTSTRFSDGFEFGLGAEIGISTQKLHARGPMGLKELTSYKYTIESDGLVRP